MHQNFWKGTEVEKEKGILSTPDECLRFMQELPDKYRQMSIFDM